MIFSTRKIGISEADLTKKFVRNSKAKEFVSLVIVDEEDIENLKTMGLSKMHMAFVRESGFLGRKNEKIYLPNNQGKVTLALVGKSSDQREMGAVISKLASNIYKITNSLSDEEYNEIVVGFLMSIYRFDCYLSGENRKEREQEAQVNLCIPDLFEVEPLVTLVASDFLARDLINMPASDLNPNRFEKLVKEIVSNGKATVKVFKGDELLEQGFPLIHAVGRASNQAPRLIELVWGNKTSPAVTIVGKGVCFDTGGLNIKGSGAMSLMKKDMGGGGIAVALANYIMKRNLNIRLKLLIPIVENSISSSSFRPGDILTSRKGKTIEVNNTDAEGRLILADALAYADENSPSFIFCLATLTGAARVALGSEVVPFYCDSDKLADSIMQISKKSKDPLWRLPFYTPYEDQIKSRIADLDNAPSGGMAGSITAALFLKKFVEKSERFVHFDLYAWNIKKTPLMPVGAKAQVLPSLCGLVESISDKKIQ